MNKLYYYSLLFLLTPFGLFGQESTKINLTDSLTLPSGGRGIVKMEIVKGPAYFTGKKIVVKKPEEINRIEVNLRLFGARLILEDNLYFKTKTPPSSILVLLPIEAEVTLQRPTYVTIGFKKTITAGESFPINFTFQDSNNQEIEAKLRVESESPPSEEVTAPKPVDPCANQTQKQDRYKCLKKVQNRTIQQQDELTALETEREQTSIVLKGFNKELIAENSYEIVCDDCPIDQFYIDKPRGVNKKPPWIIKNIKRDMTVIIQSIDWNDLYWKIPLDYTPPVQDYTPPVQAATEEVIESQEETESQEDIVGIEGNEPQDTSYLKTDTIPVISAQAGNTFWQDSIRPLLTVTNVFSQDEELFRRLSIYKKEGDSRERLIVATLVLNWWIIPLGLIAVVLFLRMVLNRNRWKKTTKSKNVSNPIEQPVLPENPPQKMNGTVSTMTAEANVPEEEEVIEDITIMEIHKDELETVAKLPYKKLKNHTDYLKIDLLKCWSDSMVQTIYFGKKSIQQISELLKLENNYDPQLNNVEELSEIGGFLLGHFYPANDQEPTFNIAISTFVPITPEVNNRYTVKFGNEAWSELDEAYQRYPGQRLVGWFHTHPGHGLFLSNADIKVHNDSFQERYQFAMEIDPATPACDIAFFTRKKDGNLNNVDDRLMPRWFSFRELELRSKSINH